MFLAADRSSSGRKGAASAVVTGLEKLVYTAIALSTIGAIWVIATQTKASAHQNALLAQLENAQAPPEHLFDYHHKKVVEYFPQARLCSRQWVKDYSRMHAKIRSGRADPYYFVSVAVAAGLADRIIGMMTQFYIGALLQGRAFVAHDWGLLPSFTSTCESPYFDWMTPLDLPEDVIDPLKTSYKGLEKNEFGYGIFPPTVDTNVYSSQVWINCEVFSKERCDAKAFHERNLTEMPKCDLKVPYVISTSNRGYTYAIATNPYHRAQFYEYGVRPEEVRPLGIVLTHIQAATVHVTSIMCKQQSAVHITCF